MFPRHWRLHCIPYRYGSLCIADCFNSGNSRLERGKGIGRSRGGQESGVPVQPQSDTRGLQQKALVEPQVSLVATSTLMVLKQDNKGF